MRSSKEEEVFHHRMILLKHSRTDDLKEDCSGMVVYITSLRTHPYNVLIIETDTLLPDKPSIVQRPKHAHATLSLNKLLSFQQMHNLRSCK
jgi:hypothetical protein